ncbi:unnamed protein product [Enterobius vermicularis]|uniref:Lipase n=1 Tax=Enterobius vermicularis TaxID=51028 RepID=A0A0N4V507_ENTVE|nr:unnamed protein product [Enterobius vermicularis]
MPPETNMNVIEIIAYHGYPAEIFTFTTPDGYILEVHRIPCGKTDLRTCESKRRPVIFFQHGLLGSSADWVTNLPNQSAAFLFADAGFDVWMGNIRGNKYSIWHKNFTSSDKVYWQFSWDEMANFDLETMINGVLEVTGREDLYYVGHSQGTLIMFAKLSNDRLFTKKIRKFFALAPVATVGHIKGLIHYIAEHFLKHPLAEIIFGNKDFLPNTRFSKMISELMCGIHYMNPLCDSVLFQIAGPESNQFNQSRVVVYLTHTPAGTSTRNIFHWSQMVKSKMVQKYDYGTNEENYRHYGQPTPPVYNLTNIDAQIYIFWSDKDWLADQTDVEDSLLNVLRPYCMKNVSRLVDFNHVDFIWGLRAADEIYKPILQTIKIHEQRRKVF